MMAGNQRTHKCAECGKVRPESEMHKRTPRHFHTQRDLDVPMWFCVDTRCAGDYQMALEG